MKLSQAILGLSLCGTSLLVGCANNPAAVNERTENYSLVAPYEESSAKEIATEVAGISEGFSFKPKVLSKATGPQTSNIQWQPWTYKNDWWYRSGSISVSLAEGELRIAGYDSVQLKDVNNVNVQFLWLAEIQAGILRHHRSAHLSGKNGGYVDAARGYELTGTLQKASDTTLMISGDLQQTFKAENSAKTAQCSVKGSATVSNVVFKYGNGDWSKPVSGTVKVVSPHRTIDITFMSGTAKIKITDEKGTVTVDQTVTL